MKFINFLIVIFTILQLNYVYSYKWTKDDISNPFVQSPVYCGLEEKGHALCDLDSSLTKPQVKYITNYLKEISRIGECPCPTPCKDGESGLVIGLLIIREYEITGDSNAKSSENEKNPDQLQDMSDFTRKKWELGTCDNSALITIATDSKQYGISIGNKATKILNETWFNAILEENFRDRKSFDLYVQLKNILFMFKEAITTEAKKNDNKSESLMSSLTDLNSNKIAATTIISIFVIIAVLVLISLLYVVLRHRKEHDDVSLRDVWTKKFWLKAGNQYKEAKQSETGDKDLEKNEDDEVKAKLASTEDLKPEDNLNKEDIQFPKLSKV